MQDESGAPQSPATGGSIDEIALDATYRSAAYRRAMWIVVLLNGGYGVIELAAGFLGDSQALKADALDLLGDGIISLLGLLAIEWSPRWRARAALAQGVFLGLLGAGVLALTVYRLFEPAAPEASVMGVVGLGALAVNLAAAFVLIPHRTGDANMRAVWIFSRNDALGNIAVVIAAVFVAILDSNLPDLVVAFAISLLFLQSSRSIIADSTAELRSGTERE